MANGQPPPDTPELAGIQTLNAFAKLSIDDGDQADSFYDEADFYDAEQFVENLPQITPVAVEQDETDLEAEFFFAIFTFICNLQELRDNVQEAWFKYKDGEIDLVQPSLIANTLVDLVRYAEAEFDLQLTRPKKYPAKGFPVWTLPALLFTNQHPTVIKGCTIEEYLLPTGLMLPGEVKCSHVYWCFVPVYFDLKYYLDAVNTSRRPKTDIVIVNNSAFDPVGGAHYDTTRACALAS